MSETHYDDGMPKIDRDGRKIVRVSSDQHEAGWRYDYAEEAEETNVDKAFDLALKAKEAYEALSEDEKAELRDRAEAHSKPAEPVKPVKDAGAKAKTETAQSTPPAAEIVPPATGWVQP